MSNMFNDYYKLEFRVFNYNKNKSCRCNKNLKIIEKSNKYYKEIEVKKRKT